MNTLYTIKIILISAALFFSRSYNVPGGERVLTKEDIFEAEKYAYYMSIRNEPFNEYYLKMVIWYEKIQTPEVVLLQAQLETGFYTSDIFRNGHNCFGMRYPKLRNTVATGEYQGHAKYNNWIDSVIDYKIWQDWYMSVGYRISDNESAQYMVFLRCVGYAEDPHYIHKLVRLSEKDMS